MGPFSSHPSGAQSHPFGADSQFEKPIAKKNSPGLSSNCRFWKGVDACHAGSDKRHLIIAITPLHITCLAPDHAIDPVFQNHNIFLV